MSLCHRIMKLMNRDLYSSDVARRIAEVLDGRTILITGGLGLVGIGILRYLSFISRSYGCRLTITITSKTRVGLTMVHGAPHEFEFMTGNLAEVEFVKSLGEFDFVVHAAGYGQPAKFLADPWSVLKINSEATMVLREKARLGLLFVSSSEVYSGLTGTAITESQIGNTNTRHPRAPYIEAKKFGEVATLVEEGVAQPQGAVARLSLAYGPGARLDDQRVLNEFVMRGLREGELSIKDSGQRLRTYCYIDDAAEMLVGAMVFGGGQILNISGESEITIRELGTLVAKLLDVDFHAPNAKDDEDDSSPKTVSLSNEKIKTLIGKTEFTNLEDGLSKTINWYRELIRGR